MLGTVRYCSVNVHNYKEQGRHDDLWSWLYMLIELVTNTLPWKGMARKDSVSVWYNFENITKCINLTAAF